MLLFTSACSGKSTPAKTTSVQGTEMQFIPSTLDLPAAKYTFHFTNVGTVIHELAIFRNGQALARREADPGASADLTAIKLSAGTYQMRCEEPGHVAAGMVGTITVK